MRRFRSYRSIIDALGLSIRWGTVGMKVLSAAVVVGAWTAWAEQLVQTPPAPAGSSRGPRDTDLAAIEELYQRDIAAT